MSELSRAPEGLRRLKALLERPEVVELSSDSEDDAPVAVPPAKRPRLAAVPASSSQSTKGKGKAHEVIDVDVDDAAPESSSSSAKRITWPLCAVEVPVSKVSRSSCRRADACRPSAAPRAANSAPSASVRRSTSSPARPRQRSSARPARRPSRRPSSCAACQSRRSSGSATSSCVSSSASLASPTSTSACASLSTAQALTGQLLRLCGDYRRCGRQALLLPAPECASAPCHASDLCSAASSRAVHARASSTFTFPASRPRLSCPVPRRRPHSRS